MYAGVVGAEMGTPDVGKRLLVEDIEVRDGEGKGATSGRERDGCQLTCCTCTKRKRKGKGKQVHPSRANLPFQDASGRDHVAEGVTSPSSSSSYWTIASCSNSVLYSVL